MKIDINYSEEKEVSHIGIYESVITGNIYLFPDDGSKVRCILIKGDCITRKTGTFHEANTPCTNKEYWTKLNADSVTFNLKD